MMIANPFRKKTIFHPLPDRSQQNIDYVHSAFSFPQKLFIILENEEGDSIRWAENGLCFSIVNEEKFLNDVMPKYFKQTKMTSFQRQLNSYGFRKISRGLDSGSYFHPKFQRDRKELLIQVQRLPLKGTLESYDEVKSSKTRPMHQYEQQCESYGYGQQQQQQLREQQEISSQQFFEQQQRKLAEQEQRQQQPHQFSSAPLGPLGYSSSSYGASAADYAAVHSNISNGYDYMPTTFPAAFYNYVSPYTSVASSTNSSTLPSPTARSECSDCSTDSNYSLNLAPPAYGRYQGPYLFLGCGKNANNMMMNNYSPRQYQREGEDYYIQYKQYENDCIQRIQNLAHSNYHPGIAYPSSSLSSHSLDPVGKATESDLALDDLCYLEDNFDFPGQLVNDNEDYLESYNY